ncbi:copper fist DNA binding domain-containing protein [Parasitella parasitica]|nr:copper fist DNA binding domain-containing protein [Parasitella parasitica]
MVYLKSADGTEKKFACIKCIKGHRSSKCKHEKRELIEIKRKGRPVSQCESCRLLRKTKQVHIKCECHPKEKETANNAPTTANLIFDQESPSNNSDITPLNVNNINDSNFSNILASTSCFECSRPKLYCNCKQLPPSTTNSSEGSITPPVAATSPFTSGSAVKLRLSYLDNVPTAYPTISAGLINNTSSPNSNSNSLPSSPMRHLTIPIHDPSDDIDSDTPIYKSVEETTHLGEFTNKSSDELMTQIYSRFPSSSLSLPTTSTMMLKEDVDDKLVELSRET